MEVPALPLCPQPIASSHNALLWPGGGRESDRGTTQMRGFGAIRDRTASRLEERFEFRRGKDTGTLKTRKTVETF